LIKVTAIFLIINDIQIKDKSNNIYTIELSKIIVIFSFTGHYNRSFILISPI